MTPVLLATLAFVDGTLCGFRAAAGRNPRIHLWPYYRASMRRGALVSLASLVVFSSLALGVRLAGGDAQWSALLATADQLVIVYGAYATVTLAALALYLVGSFDFGVLASVLVLGPFTLIRPWVIGAGAAWAVWSAPDAVSAAFALSSAALMMNFERVLELGQPPWRGLEGDRRATK